MVFFFWVFYFFHLAIATDTGIFYKSVKPGNQSFANVTSRFQNMSLTQCALQSREEGMFSFDSESGDCEVVTGRRNVSKHCLIARPANDRQYFKDIREIKPEENHVEEVLETDADEEDDGEETCRKYVAETPLKELNTSQRCKAKRKSISFEEDPTFERLIALKERRLAVEERKAKALERIASALTISTANHDHELTVLSPIIKI